MFWVLLSLGLILLLFVRANTRRGQNFIRSYYFLLCLKNGKTVEEANYLARMIATMKSDPNYDKKIMILATSFSRENFNGKQLPIINEATAKGFIK